MTWLPQVNADEIGATVTEVVGLGNRFIGTDGERKARDQLTKWFREAGLTDVRQEALRVVAYRPGTTHLRASGGQEYSPVKGLQFTTASTVRARAVYVGRPDVNRQDEWRASLDRRTVGLKGRIAVLHCSYPWLYTDELCQRGAAAIVIISDAPDGLVQNLTARFYRGPDDASTLREPVPVPGVVLEKEAGWLLLSDLSIGPVELELKHDASYQTVDTANVVGECKGTTDARAIVIGAHYDTQLDGPGANDNGAGLSVLLTLARACRGRRPARTIIFAAFADEEHGLNGALAFVQQRTPADERLGAMICVDSPGWSRLAKRCLHADATMRPIAEAYASEAGWTPDVFVPAEEIRVTDHNAFADFGVPACELERYPPGNPYYHTHCDALDRVDPEAVAGAGTAAGAIMWRLAQAVSLPWEARDTGAGNC